MGLDTNRIVKSEEVIRVEMQRLFTVFMDPSSKKPLRDECFIRFHELRWVLEDEEDIVIKRLKEIGIAGNTPSETE